MGAFHKAVLLLCLALVAGIAQAELPKNFQIILQTDNFPPFNMGPNNKHFARDAEVQGIGTDTVREIFKRPKDPLAMANVRVVSMQNRSRPEREFLACQVRVLPLRSNCLRSNVRTGSLHFVLEGAVFNHSCMDC